MSKAHILVVEDEMVISKIIRSRLERVGYNVVGCAATGDEALEKARELRPNMLLMDIQLKGKMDGIEAAGLIRTRYHIPTIYMSGHVDKDTLARAKLTEPFGYLLKPVNAKEMHTTIELALYRVGLENKLRLSEEKYRELVERMPDIIHSVDPEGFLLTTNRQAEIVLGYTRDELLRMNISDLYPPEIRENVSSGFEELKKRGILTGIRSTLMSRRGERIEVEISSSAIYDENGVFVGTQSILRDMRENKRLKELKKAFSDLKAAQAQIVRSGKMAALGQFAAGVAHEIRNPLTSVTMNVALLIDELAEDPKKLKKLKRIEKEIDQTTKIVKSLLSFSHADNGEAKAVSVSLLIDETLDLRGAEIKRSGVEVERRYDPAAPQAIVNRSEIIQVFLNLINNAVDAMPEGGKLTFDVAPETITEDSPVNGDPFKPGDLVVRALFADNGEGMTKETMAKIFHPFYTTKETGKGTGLGLFICLGIIEKHGGTMDVEAEKGKGTTFSVRLPAEKKNG